MAHSTARVQCRRSRRNRGTQHAHLATRIAASLSSMCSLAVSCSLQPPFHPCAPARAHLNRRPQWRIAAMHRAASTGSLLRSPRCSHLLNSRLRTALSCSRDVPFSLTATRSSFCFFANYHSNHPSSSTYRLVSHWDYLMYGPALHTVITCATAPHSRNAQGCIRSATTQLSNVICGTDLRCRGRQ